jgi:hypothetical protein
MHAIVLMLSLAAQPDDVGFALYGGPLNGGIGVGWRFSDGSRVDVGPRGVAYSRTLHETEGTRHPTVSGSWPGAAWEVYLGHGFAVDTGTGRMAAVWYPLENVSLSFGVDLLTGRRGWGWQVGF